MTERAVGAATPPTRTRRPQAIGASIAEYALAWAGYSGAVKAAGQPQDSAVLDRMQLAVGVVPAACFVVALLVMATYPLTEARFQEIVEAIQTRRAQRRRADTGEPDMSSP